MTKNFRWITGLATAAIALSLMSPVSSSASTCAGLDYQGCDLRNAKFEGSAGGGSNLLNLKTANFSGANLEGATFKRVNLEGANFANANLSGSSFDTSLVNSCNFNKSNLSGATLINSQFLNADFTDAKLAGVQTYGSATFSNAQDRRTKFPADWQEWSRYLIGPGAKLWSFRPPKDIPITLPAKATGGVLHFEGLECIMCNFEGQDLSKANFSKAVFTGGVGFSGAKLSGANFTSVKIASKHPDYGQWGSYFKGSDLSGANFSYAELPYADFEGANLSKTNFSYAKLLEPDFQKTNLSGANLSKSILTGGAFSKDLTKINLSDAVLTYFDLGGANLTGANLTGLLATEVYGKPIGLPKGWKVVGTRLAATFVKTGIPTVTGTYSKGSTLSAVPGTWDAGTKFKYQWKRNGFAIPKATSQKYKLTANDSGQNISVSVTGVKSDRFELTKTSSPKKSK